MATRKKAGSRKGSDSGESSTGPGPGQGGTQVPADADDWTAVAASAEVKKAIRGHFDYRENKSNARKKINADIASSRKSLEARSLNPHAIKAMEQYFQMDGSKRAGWIQSVLIIMQAMGDPLQHDMLAGLVEGNDKVLDDAREQMSSGPDQSTPPSDPPPGSPAGIGGTNVPH